MLQPVKLPRGIAKLFSIGESATVKVPELWAFRPDKIMKTVGQESMSMELINNYISNVSPITLQTGDDYTVISYLYKEYFAKI